MIGRVGKLKQYTMTFRKSRPKKTAQQKPEQPQLASDSQQVVKLVERSASSPQLLRSRAGRPPALEANERNQSILDAATAVFLDRGFSRASTAEIARRAGASKQTLYARYPTKSALFAALMERRSETLLSSYSDLIRQDVPVEQALLEFGKKLVGTLLYPETRLLYRLVVAEAVEFPEIALKFWQIGPGRVIEQLHSYLQTQVEKQILTISNITYAAEQLHGALIGVLNIRIALEITNSVPADKEIDAWVASAIHAFLRAYKN